MSLDFTFLCKMKGLPSKVFLKLNVAKGQFVLSFFFSLLSSFLFFPSFISFHFIFKMLQTSTQFYFIQVVCSLCHAWLRSSAPSRLVCEPLEEASPVNLLLDVVAGSNRCDCF